MTASVFAGGVSPWAGLQQQAPKPEPKPKAMKKPAPTPQPKAPPPALAPIKRKTRTDTNGSRVDPEELVIANDPLPGARLVTSVALLALTTVTDPATTDRAPGPAADVVLGTVETR